MNATSYQSLALAWQPKSRHDKPFVVFALFTFIFFLGIGLFFSSIKTPKEERRENVAVPDRVAKFILDNPKPVTKPKPVPKKVIPLKPKPIAKPNVKREKPKSEIKLTEKQKVAREVASESGLIALADELSDLMDTSSIDAMVGNSIKKSTGSVMQVTSINTDILTSNSAEEHRGVYLPKIPVVSVTKFENEQVSAAKTLITARASEALDIPESITGESVKQERVGNYRSAEDIAFVVDKNKGKLHAIYRRARRSDPGIQGKIVLEITILPSGKVEGVRVTSSELQNEKLEARIISRVKQFDFGAKNVNKVTVTYPIEFLPS